jgi:hypothetical protein
MGVEFGRAAFIGLCIGLIWGVGCSLVLLYSIYLAGYRKAVKDSLAPEKSKRFNQILESIEARRSEERASER